jgi:hypothetical protein
VVERLAVMPAGQPAVDIVVVVRHVAASVAAALAVAAAAAVAVAVVTGNVIRFRRLTPVLSGTTHKARSLRRAGFVLLERRLRALVACGRVGQR